MVIVFMWGNGMANIRPAPLFEQWLTNTSNLFDANKLDDHKSQVIFYREAGAVKGPAVNVYIDGDYHVSLLENHYKRAELCAQTHVFGAVFSSSTLINKPVGVYYTIPAKQSSFIKVITGANGRLEFERVDAKTGEQAISTMPSQKQVLSRVMPARECKEKTVLQNFALSAKALFKNSQFGIDGMMESGKIELHELAQDLKRLDSRYISHIVISGHSAPSESKEVSKKLSANRSRTVLKFLQQEGVQFPMEVIGYGAKQVVSKNCAARNPDNAKMREACEQSNRRVEVTVYSIL